MTQQVLGKQVQNPLTLVMTAKSEEDYAALQQLVKGIYALPPEENPIHVAMDNLANVHFARWVFLDHNQLAVITTYDGDFDDYINDFINEIGEVFDKVFVHIADSPPLSVRAHRDEFLAYARAHDLGCVGQLYSAYPNRTVLDIIN